jgi:spermidine/putrescine-binding protein
MNRGKVNSVIDLYMTDRRGFLKAASALGLGVAMTPVFGRSSEAAATLSYFGWNGYEIPELHTAYTKAYGGEPTATFFSDEEEALQKVRAGFNPDVIHPCVNTVRRFKDAGLIKPLDTKQIAGWDNIFPQFLSVKDVKEEDGYYIMPFDWGTSSVIYRPDLVDIKEESWTIFLDDRYKGKMAFLDSPDNIAAVAGLLSGAKNPMDMHDEEMAKASDILRHMNSNMRFYWTDNTELEQSLASGEVVAAWGWGQSVNNLKKQGVDIKMMNPKEGIMTWICGLTSTVKGKCSDKERYDFMSAMLAPESGKYLIEQYGYGHANQESFKVASPESVALLGFKDPNDFLKTGNFFTAVEPAKREKIQAMWATIKAGG